MIEFNRKTGRSIETIQERIKTLKDAYEIASKDLYKINKMFSDLDLGIDLCSSYDEEILLKIIEAVNNNRIELCYLRGE